MNLADTRKHIAEALTSALTDVRVYPHRPSAIRVRDGWLNLRSITPYTFQTCTATFDVLIVVGTEEQAAADYLDRTSVDLLDVAGDVFGAPQTLTPQSLIVDGTDMFCAVLTVLVEVE